MKYIYSILLFFTISLCSHAQCPTSIIVLETQADVDAFQSTYPNCTQILNGLQIGPATGSSDINNLNNLQGLVQLDGGLNILNNPLLNDLTAFSTLTQLEDIYLFNNPGITNFNGFQGITSINDIKLEQSFVTDFSGLSNIDDVHKLWIVDDTVLNDLSGLNQLVILNFLELDNTRLTSINSFDLVDQVEWMIIKDNDFLTSIDGFGTMTMIDNLSILRNSQLSTISQSFQSLRFIQNNLIIKGNINLSDISGFSSIQTVDTIQLDQMIGSQDLSFFNTILQLRILRVTRVDSITSLNGLQNALTLTYISIENNPLLTDINAIGGSNANFLTGMRIVGNPLLAICDVPVVCNYLSGTTSTATINGNATGCASEQEIANECELNVISGTIYYDTNGSGDYSPATDAVVPYYKVFSTHSTGTSTTFSKAYGDYSNYVGTGNINTDVEDLSMFAFTPANGFNNNFTGYGNVASGDFEAQTTNTVQDVSIDLIATIATRPGFTAGYKLIAINKGSVPVSGTIELPYNSNLFTYQTSVPAASTVSTGMLNWSYNLGPFERLRIDVEFLVAQPPVLIGGETEAWTATINPIPGDANPQDNVFYYNNNIVNSYDPNDKTVFEGAEILPTELDEYLHYRIRFQNTGTASAINVTVKDTLSDNLDWDTFEPIDMSHNVGEIHIENKRFIDFDFPNINLPDSTTNEPLSHGYIYYRIKPKQNLVIGDFIDNTAHIYFDFNEAIITNTATTTIVQTLSNSDQEFLNISLYPNPVADIVQLQTSEKIDFAVIMNLQGQLLIETTDKDINVSNLDTGVYFIRVTSGNKSQVLKFIKK
ncbi:T9SS type A sorting domain-containing protein [Nonlabens ulvanivorans]|uniref:Repeat protein (TIGR01451 family)/predicted secreted protein (Por secretion system target) n=5 Tax=Nonlabens ulvanivorans TaxID=906888 RepID=A0A084JVI5_NONUL|nr:T9SS type A sorting domain-containing protein [Nonlabens ulvanivorans]KEZ92969.1 hypothetical protein IL45_12645 [Nonlabens ulvanivorans]PRX12801.1 putative repeat protein (TIGR01451 family)/predicted secreted protein (Por secretion system target) [Nonlabens ulvanivorans]